MTDDRSSSSPFVAYFFQVAKDAIATLYMIVPANLATNGWGTINGRAGRYDGVAQLGDRAHLWGAAS